MPRGCGQGGAEPPQKQQGVPEWGSPSLACPPVLPPHPVQGAFCALAGGWGWPPALRSPPVLPAAALGALLNGRKALPHPLTGSQGSKHRRSPPPPLSSPPLPLPPAASRLRVGLGPPPGTGGTAGTPAPPQLRHQGPPERCPCARAHTCVCVCVRAGQTDRQTDSTPGHPNTPGPLGTASRVRPLMGSPPSGAQCAGTATNATTSRHSSPSPAHPHPPGQPPQKFDTLLAMPGWWHAEVARCLAALGAKGHGSVPRPKP